MRPKEAVYRAHRPSERPQAGNKRGGAGERGSGNPFPAAEGPFDGA
jgi:hypothetical protein